MNGLNLEKIKDDDLHNGMFVAIPRTALFGWNQYAGFDWYLVERIARITPKRTKVIMESGREYEVRKSFLCEYSDKVREYNRKYTAWTRILSALRELEQTSRKNLVSDTETMEADAAYLEGIIKRAKESEKKL